MVQRWQGLVTELHSSAFKRGTESDKSLEIASNGENISQTKKVICLISSTQILFSLLLFGWVRGHEARFWQKIWVQWKFLLAFIAQLQQDFRLVHSTYVKTMISLWHLNLYEWRIFLEQTSILFEASKQSKHPI